MTKFSVVVSFSSDAGFKTLSFAIPDSLLAPVPCIRAELPVIVSIILEETIVLALASHVKTMTFLFFGCFLAQSLPLPVFLSLSRLFLFGLIKSRFGFPCSYILFLISFANPWFAFARATRTAFIAVLHSASKTDAIKIVEVIVVVIEVVITVVNKAMMTMVIVKVIEIVMVIPEKIKTMKKAKNFLLKQHTVFLAC